MTSSSSGASGRSLSIFVPYKEAVWAVLVVVAIVDLLFTLDAIARGYPPKLSHLPGEVLVYFVICALAYPLYVIMQASKALPGWLRILLIIAFSIAVGLIQPPIIRQLLRLTTDHPIGPVTIEFSLRRIQIGALPYLAVAAGLLAAEFYRAVREREGQLLRSQAMAAEAQLLALRYQIDPHFLFNSLNAVSSLVLTQRNDAAEDMLLRLSAFFRRTLEHDASSTIPLDEELELQDAYLHIVQVRFGDAITASIDAPPDLLQASVPALILQPLVENAVKYGAPVAGQAQVIEIRARASGQQLHLSVRNAVTDPLRRGAGVGLANVRHRLASLFGSNAEVVVDDGDPSAFEVTLKLPLIQAAAAA